MERRGGRIGWVAVLVAMAAGTRPAAAASEADGTQVVAGSAPEASGQQQTQASGQEDTNASGRKEAEGAFVRGREAMRTGDYERACRWFAASDRVAPAPGTVLNLALCEERLGHLSASEEHFARFLILAPPHDDRREIVVANLEALRVRIPRLVVRAPLSEHAGARLELDGRALSPGELGVPLALDPGEHELAFSVPGRSAARTRFVATEMRTVERALEPGPLLSPERVAMPVRSSSPPIAAHVLTGIGAASLVTSLVSALFILREKQVVGHECTDSLCSETGLEAARMGQTLDRVATISFAAGLAGVGAGAYLYLRSTPPTPGVGTARSSYVLSLSGAF